MSLFTLILTATGYWNSFQVLNRATVEDMIDELVGLLHKHWIQFVAGKCVEVFHLASRSRRNENETLATFEVLSDGLSYGCVTFDVVVAWLQAVFEVLIRAHLFAVNYKVEIEIPKDKDEVWKVIVEV